MEEPINAESKAFDELQEELAVLCSYEAELREYTSKKSNGTKEENLARQVIQLIDAWKAWQNELENKHRKNDQERKMEEQFDPDEVLVSEEYSTTLLEHDFWRLFLCREDGYYYIQTKQQMYLPWFTGASCYAAYGTSVAACASNLNTAVYILAKIIEELGESK